MKKKKFVFVLSATLLAIIAIIVGVVHFMHNDKIEMTRKSVDRDYMKFPLEQHLRINPLVSNESKKIAEMLPDDVIVAVNGYPLLKRDYVERMKMLRTMIYRRVKNNLGEADQIFEEMRKRFIDQFVSQRLLIDNATKLGVMSDEKLCEEMMSELAKVGKKRKLSPEELLSKYGNNAKHIAYETAERVLVKELVAQKIPPVTKVEDTFVSNAQAQVTLENKIATATNVLRRQMLEGFRRDISTGKTTFDNLVEKHMPDSLFEISSGGEWETVSRGELENPNLEELVFSAEESDILPIQEDPDGIDLIQLRRIIPPVRDSKGEIIEAEKRELARIRISKEGLFLRQTDAAMKKDLEMQMQLQAIDAYVQNLATNGQNTVVYPYGNDLF